MFNVTAEFIAAGGNRHPSAADWSVNTGILAFGSGCNIALWRPLQDNDYGISNVLTGHTDAVNAVKFFPAQNNRPDTLLSGSADSSIRVWACDTTSANPFDFVQTRVLSEHEKSVNVISVLSGSNLFASGAADSTVKVWRLGDRVQDPIELLQSISLVPRFLPLTLAVSFLPCSKDIALAVGGTNSNIQIYVSNGSSISFSLAATLAGHEGWIRSLSFVNEHERPEADLVLASASQDKYIRLWRVHAGQDIPAMNETANEAFSGTVGRSMSNKVHQIKIQDATYSITFEALLLGHEDWVYTTQWRRTATSITLLSASADNSLAIWEADPLSGIWICTVRLGEISAQKGATTATGSTGGFWIGLWSPDGEAVLSLGRTGSWRLWSYSTPEDKWIQDIAVGGHTREVKDIAWSKDGAYLLSTSSDQTTRLFAAWKREKLCTWHELSRPQIHGYDLNCIDSISHNQFISGADEKLLRVFNEPKAVARSLSKLCGLQVAPTVVLPDAANIPVLGLSNKAIELNGDDVDADFSAASVTNNNDTESELDSLRLEAIKPPLEDQLARHLLWPETEKLYGHGYEISAVAAAHDESLVATACRASSIDHAVIRLYDTKEWREVKPPLKCHSLTVTSLEFSPDDKYLLSVGRDRQYAIHLRRDDNPNQYELYLTNAKAHSRMLLDASWGPLDTGRVFATSGRDKTIKIWKLQDNEAIQFSSISAPQPITTISFLPFVEQGQLILAFGLETGSLHLCRVSQSEMKQTVDSVILETPLNPSKAITRLTWRPKMGLDNSDDQISGMPLLAIASADHSVRIYKVQIP